MIPFDFEPRTRIVFGAGNLARLGEFAKPFGARVLVVSDPGVIRAGHTGRALEVLREFSLEPLLFDGVHENPTTADVDRGCAVAHEFRPDVLIAVGGGSSMDCAKGINFLYTNGGEMQDYWGVGKAETPMLPMIAVPTTAGTGSETQSFALISDAETHVKMACGDKKAACRIAVLDPELTVTQPARITALTGYDALAHAVETYVTNRRTPFSRMWSRRAWQLLVAHYTAVLREPTNLESRGAMQIGASFAGTAIENSMLGAAHALANPLTARFDIIHGQAVALTLPNVVRFNAAVCAADYRHFALDAGLPVTTDHDATEALAQLLERLRRNAGLAERLRDCGVEPADLQPLAEDAAQQWTGTFNPREIDVASLMGIYQRCW